ncbi:LacI family DNA-binding transcriptional regulator [Alkalihalophilus lindianensis]|uniref:LacI family DNA-binding transcriptional regulator n=1 Tax=Alkalihalophilus lindianensis TaxID=1630542 RepID=A0ABU3X870_9BACI|nr:LacI family DNA-binding transcriptional regulator [Alkalihalophilus lindianensis]MDV2684082.1 LacI family DNA-binding transcriptional regulator [Alkalihalophilus lindianensis]
MQKDINISEVAKKAGVSIATVSRVFNNSGRVKESTRKKIQAIIEETGYRPNVLARELAEKKTHLIGMIVHSLTGEGLPRAINGVNQVLDENGYNLLIACSEGSFANEKKHFELFRLKRVDGIIFATRQFKPEHAEWIKKLPIPVVVLLQDTQEQEIPFVAFDNKRFAKEATKTLLEQGHQAVAYLGGPENSVNSAERKSGVEEALGEVGLQLDRELIGQGNYLIESGYNEMEKIIQKGKRFDSVIAVNDGMAIGALNCLQDHGFNIPNDVSVLGLDDTVLTQASRLKLSGVHYSYTDLGRQGADMLLRQIGQEEISFEKIMIPFEVKLRETVKNKEKG